MAVGSSPPGACRARRRQVPGGHHASRSMAARPCGSRCRPQTPAPDPSTSCCPGRHRSPGRHTLRFTAQLTFADQTLGVETREIPEVVYGIYQADSVEAASVRSFINAAQNANVRELDPSLPEAPFGAWLQAIAKAAPNADFEPAHEYAWEVHYCDERLGEERAYSAVGDLCTVAHLGVADGHDGIARIWDSHGTHRTGGGNIRWTAAAPSVEAIQLRRPTSRGCPSSGRCSRYPPRAGPHRHLGVPRGHSTDARAGRRARGAIVRNGGTAAAHDVHIHLTHRGTP